MSAVSNTKLKNNEPEDKVYVRQLKSSSALSFARSLFHAAEGKELFQDGFIFCQRSLDLLFAIPFGRNVDASALLAADPNRRSHTGIRKLLKTSGARVTRTGRLSALRTVRTRHRTFPGSGRHGSPLS